MFKSRKKDVRRRPMAKKPIDEESEDSDVSVGTAPPPPPQEDSSAAIGANGRPKKMRKKGKDKKEKGPKPVLSFGHEDEDDKGEGDAIFRVKKSKASKVCKRVPESTCIEAVGTSVVSPIWRSALVRPI